MERNPFSRLALAAAFALAASAATAAPIDIASYMGLKPGTWIILQDNQTASVMGSVVSQGPTGEIVQTWYRLQGQTWVFDSSQTFLVSALRVTLTTENDGTTALTYDPPVALPRRMQVDQPVLHKGLLRNPATGEAAEVTLALSITAAGIDVSVPAGAFSACIKTRLYTYGGGSSRDSVSINCLGRPEAKTWYNKISDSANPVDEDQSESHSSVMIQAGDSNPPLP